MRYWLHITSGRGPEECRWVVTQLVRFIKLEANSRNLRTTLLESVSGNFPGTLKSALIAIEGEHDFTEFISSWEGSVQWIGKSMFRPQYKRKNWFVGIDILKPDANKNFGTNDIKIECMKSSGPGGQHANKTDSAVRATHLPTGLSTTSQEERSQYHNKKLALARLAKLLETKEHNNQSLIRKRFWNRHNKVMRGNPIIVFEGKNFNLRRN